MTWLIYFLLGIVVLFLVTFVVGFFTASITHTKRFRANALSLFTNLTDHEKEIVSKIWVSFKENRAKLLADELSVSEKEHIASLLNPRYRKTDLSSGKLFDHTTWQVWFNQAREKGFDEFSSEVIAGVGLNGLEEFVY